MLDRQTTRTRPAPRSIHDGPARSWRRSPVGHRPDFRGRLAGARQHRADLARRAGVLARNGAASLGDAAGSAASALVYLGLAQLVAGTLDLASCAAGWNNAALLAGWLAVAGALLGLALWAAGVVSRRVKLSEFYTEPCFHTAFALTVGAYVVALRGSVSGPRSLRARRGGARLERAGHDAARADVAHGRVDLCRRLPLRHGDVPGPLQRGQERPGDGLCAGPGRGDRGDRALGDRVCLSARARHLDERLRSAALSLGRSADRRRGSALRSLIRGARPGGRFLPLDRQEPATRGVALWHGRGPARGLLFPLARPTAAYRADRLRDARGFCALGPGRLDPAS